MGVTRIDFIQGPAAATGWRLALLAAGVLAFGASGTHWIVQARAAGALEERVAQARPREARTAALTPAQQRAQEQQLKIIGDAVRQMNLPVPRLVRTVQAPPDVRVALLGMDLGSKGGSGEQAGALKISGEAETAQDMMNYVAYLDGQPLFTTVYLVKHELNPNPKAQANPSGQPYRFELEAQWEE